MAVAVGSQEGDVVFQLLRVPVQLGFEHFQGGQDVGFRGVGVFQRLPAVKFVGGTQGAFLQPVENVLNVYRVAILKVKIDVGAEHFFGEQGNVELVGIVSGQVTAYQVVGYFGGNFGKRRAVGHHFVGDAVNG